MSKPRTSSSSSSTVTAATSNNAGNSASVQYQNTLPVNEESGPFEQPTIADLLPAFVNLRYGAGVSASKQANVAALVGTTQSALAGMTLPAASTSLRAPAYERLLAKHRAAVAHRKALRALQPALGDAAGAGAGASAGNAGLDYDDVALSTSVVHLFGRQLLLGVLPQLREAVFKRAVKTTGELRPLIKPFFDALDEELRNPRSTICGPFDVAQLADDDEVAAGFAAALDQVASTKAAAAAAASGGATASLPVPTLPATARTSAQAGNHSDTPSVKRARNVSPAPPPPPPPRQEPVVATTTAAAAAASSAAATTASGDEPVPRSLVNEALRDAQRGALKVCVITNDGTRDALKGLVTLKELFSKQLPKMPKDYIVRLVFDRRHQALSLVKDDAVIGGVCFRPFEEQGFLEIAFLAITQVEQVKGYGSLLMSQLKEYAKRIGIYHFLTYADNFAIGYFKKQGFAREVLLEQRKWKGYIKDYDGATLLECVLHPKINYLDVRAMLKAQRDAVLDQIKLISHSHMSYPGLTFFRHGKTQVRIEDIPGIVAAGYKPSTATLHEKSLKDKLRDFLRSMKAHEAIWPFTDPVDPNEVPDYYDVFKNPIDLTTIGKRLDDGFYITKEIFRADLQRMIDNCKFYNGPDTVFQKCAAQIEDRFIKNFHI
jgi:N-acetylglutamate synthase-like GNAT family acetyltransferase